MGVQVPPRTPGQVLDQGFLAGPTQSRPVSPGFEAWGFKTRSDTPFPAHAGPERLPPGVRSRTSCSLASGAWPGPSCSPILAASQPDASAGRVAVTSGDAPERQLPPDVGLGRQLQRVTTRVRAAKSSRRRRPTAWDPVMAKVPSSMAAQLGDEPHVTPHSPERSTGTPSPAAVRTQSRTSSCCRSYKNLTLQT